MVNTDDFSVSDTGKAEKKIRVPMTFWSTIPKPSSKDDSR